MLTRAFSFLSSCLVVTYLMLGAFAAAQEDEWLEAGSVVATVDGVQQTKHAYDVRIQDEDGITYVPGATFAYVAEMKSGDVVLMPAYFHVTVLAYDIESEEEEYGVIELNILVDAETLQPTRAEDQRVVYYPTGPSETNWYLLTEGGLTLDPVVVVDADTWSVSGTIVGYVSRQHDYSGEHNPADMLRFEATFEFPRVVRQEMP